MKHQNPVFEGRPARLQDVADAAGVSTATVSRAHTVPESVTEATRRRVMEAARRLGYTPNEAARTLRAGSSRMVLVLVPLRCSEVFFAGVIAGIDDELSAQGYTMIMGSLEGNDVKIRRLSDLVFARHLDGVIVVTGAVPEHDGRSILHAGVPVVSICAEITGPVLQSVLIDDEACAAIQVRHLTELGHRRLMYVAGIEGNFNEVWRYRGFLRGAEEAGLRPTNLIRHAGDYSLASGAAAAKSYLALDNRPSGVVFAGDEMAIGFLKIVQEAGLQCPADVSIVGFDGIEYADFCEPTLTTIRQPRHELGATGARALLAALRGDATPIDSRVVLVAELVVRSSTAEPPDTTRCHRNHAIPLQRDAKLGSKGSVERGKRRSASRRPNF